MTYEREVIAQYCAKRQQNVDFGITTYPLIIQIEKLDVTLSNTTRTCGAVGNNVNVAWNGITNANIFPLIL